MDTLFKILGFIISIGICYESEGKEIKLKYQHLDHAVYPLSSPYLLFSEDNLGGVRYSGIFAQDDSNRVWFFVDSEVWFFSLADRTWIKHGELLGLKETDQISYNSFWGRFFIWSENGSFVRTWKPGQLKLEEIQTLNDVHIYKYHSGTIDPNTGTILAIGGRAYGVDFGLIWSFNLKDPQWKVVPINRLNQPPPARHSASILLDSKERNLHLFGGGSFKDGRRDVSEIESDRLDYWIYDLDESVWSEKTIFGVSDEDYDQKSSGTYRSHSLNGLFDQKNDLIWFHYKGMKDVIHSLIVFDLKSGYGIHIPVSLLDMIEKPILRHMSLDPVTNELIMFWSPWVSDQNLSLIRVSMTKLPDAALVRSMIENAIQETQTADSLKMRRNLILKMSLLTLMILVGFASFRLYRKKVVIKKGKEELSISPPMIWTLELTSHPTIKINGRVINEYFSKHELHLISWMSWKYYTGEKFQLTDIIEEYFFSSNNNLDYLRKQRNNTFKRINEQLSRLSSKHIDRTEWILDRYLYADKRKREYAMDLDHVTVEVEFIKNESGEVMLLPNFDQPWVLDIRKDVSKLNETKLGVEPTFKLA